MANHALPTTTSLYTDVLTNLKDRIDDSLKMLDSVNTTPTNVPTNSVRFNSTTFLWEKYNGSAWVSLASSYAIQVSKSINLTGGNSTTLLGSIPYQSNTDSTTLLAPNTTTTRKFLRQTGSGTNGSAPVWDTILASDIPILNQNTTGSAGSCTGNSATATTATSAGSCTGNSATATKLTSSQGDWSASGVIGNVVGMLAWKNYGNGHVIFDASASTAPNGAAVNNTNSEYAWTYGYPSLMGWNGGQTYGVRVDSARVADSATTATTAANADKLIGKNWYWSGQGGQPTWLWGGSDGTNMYVYNPANFVVYQASSLTNHQWASLGGSGYMRLSTGLIIQWGKTGAVSSGATVTVTFPIAFTITTPVVTCNADYSGTGNNYQAKPEGTTATTVTIRVGNATAESVHWIAIGY